MTKLNEYLTIKEAAEFLGVSQNTLRNWGKSGKLKERQHPVNGYRLYSPQVLIKLLDAGNRRKSLVKKKPR